MNADLALTALIQGDPLLTVASVMTPADVRGAVGAAPVVAGGALMLAPGVALVHALVASADAVALRLVRLPHAPSLVEGQPARVALVVLAPLAQAAVAVRVVGRLKACLREPALGARLAVVTTREELVRALATVSAGAGETPLAGTEVSRLLGVGGQGLTTAEVAQRVVLCGPNVLERVRRRPLAARFLQQFVSFFAVLLWAGAGLALLAQLPELAAAIAAVVVVNGVFSFLQEYRAERALEMLQRLLPGQVVVVRDGREQQVTASALVPGDLVRLAEGDQVPADGQVLAADGLRVDQSALTGESRADFKLPANTGAHEQVPALERHERVFAGTGVVAGAGLCVVTATGMATEIGGIARLTQTVAAAPSPLQQEMARVTRIVTMLAAAFGVTFFAVGLAAGTFPLAEGLVFAIGVIVANVPEGLLPTLTLALALGVERMARQGSVVKRLSAVETLGATTVICTDKTGTLTEGRMSALALWVSGAIHELGGVATDGVREALEAAVLASQASAERGDPTEVALVRAAVAIGIVPEQLRSRHPVLRAFPFDSFRRRMTLARAAASGPVAYVKGAPRETLALCTTIRWHGASAPLTDAHRTALLAAHDRLAAEGLRLLAVAVRPLADSAALAEGDVERELTLLALVALWDPPRAEVAGAVAACGQAGIRVVMITGDYGLTARAIAARVGIEVETLVTGDEVAHMTTEALRDLVGRRGVLFARASPHDKLAIVRALRERSDVVAVTGDGVNDAPALKAADIGVAMGRRGTEVAKEAAEMVITDDNFASVVVAVRLGRSIWSNMGKFVTYIFASNVPELVPFLAAVFLRIPLPLTVMQILAVDLGTDLLPALALGAEPPERDVMQRPPRGRTERLLGARRLAYAYGFLGAIEAVVALAAFFWTYALAGWRPGLPMEAAGPLYRRATTMTLAAIVAGQIGNVFACRTERESIVTVGVTGNRLLLAGVAAELAILLALITVPPLRSAFGLAPLRPAEWLVLLPVPALVLLLAEARKWLLRRRRARAYPPR
ncbi:MAG TPA: cation-transporting P-type ATPase [Methylomirabilota bacterium]|nr:cation-transporting P-type ATPase [Methylomirabilota bacterium]